MPLYDFRCDDCGREFERLLLKPDETVQCPSCLGQSVTRLTVAQFSCTGVHITKRLRMESEERMKRGAERMSRQNQRRQRIKIL